MRECIFIAATFLLFGVLTATPLPDDSLVVSTTNLPGKESQNNKDEDAALLQPTIYEMDVQSNVSNRFSKTLVTSKVKNPSTYAKEATFAVILPETAFISEFVMEIGGKSYKAHVKAKEEAKEMYREAKERGQSAAHVAVSARDSNRFTVSVNIEPKAKATFYLTYEELLQRQLSQYEVVISIHPGQIVKNLRIEVHINESRPLLFVKTPSLRTGNEIIKNDQKLNPSTRILFLNTKSAVVRFAPDVEQQEEFGKLLGNKEGNGIAGQFVVQYDVEKDPNGGEVLLQDGYFVHFFAPSELDPLPKQVVFVLDTSGSMTGEKIEQLRQAMQSILNEIKGDNLLSIVEFSSCVNVWDIKTSHATYSCYENLAGTQNVDNGIFAKISEAGVPLSIKADEDVIGKAKKIAEQLNSGGLTNMILGLYTALYLVNKSKVQYEDKYQPLIIFLTDGFPTSSSAEEIVERITKLNEANNKAPIFSLSFGEGADKGFLRKLSSKNYGFSRHIYEAADASLQLQQFYKQISSPLLSNVQFKYESDVEQVTNTRFPTYFSGSELVVSGRYVSGMEYFEPGVVKCWGLQGLVILKPKFVHPVSSLERLWAYLTVKQTLEQRDSAENKTELTKKALDIALKYSFVTDVTSLVVVKPNETSAVDTENAATPSLGSSFGSWPQIYKPAASSYNSYSLPRYYGVGHSGGYYGGGHRSALRFASSAGQSYYSRYPYPSSGASAFSPPLYSYGPDAIRPSPVPVYSYRPGTIQPRPPPSPRPQSDSGTTTVRPTTAPGRALAITLPWLPSVLNPNGSLSLPQGTFYLGDQNTIPTPVDCPKTPLNETGGGFCTLLRDCPQVHSLLKDFDGYKQYFCPLNNIFAGICCPTMIM